jgi:hypothetical protein
LLSGLARVEDAYCYILKGRIQEQIDALEKALETKKITIKKLVDALALPYMEVYTKVAPALRHEGHSSN